MKLHPESAKLFQRDEAVEKAKNIALRLLSGRAYTQREIQDKLFSKDCSEQAVVETLKTLDRLGLIDDRRFARQFVEERMRLKPAGRMLLLRDLKRRGVPEAIVVEVLDDMFAEADPVATATDMLVRRAHRYCGLPRDKALSRMYGFLGRRGFDASVARAAAQVVWKEIGSETTDNHR